MAATAQYLSSIGILADFFGVILLGIDLLRVQSSLQLRASNALSHLDDIASEYGGIEGWSADIEKSARWISSHEYSDRHAEDEASFNARHLVERSKELANCVGGLAGHLSKLMKIYGVQANEDRVAARMSRILSVVGLSLVAVGFVLQLWGSWPS